MNYNLILISLIILAIFYCYYYYYATDNQSGSVVESMESTDAATENRNLKLMVKYLTLLLRKQEAQKELYRLVQGNARVYHSPQLDTLDKQIYELKKVIQSDPKTLDFFKFNLDLIIV